MNGGSPGAVLAGGPVVIVGGGVIGVSVAYHLAELGYPDVTVIDRGLLGEGSTAKATGGIRTQFSSQVNIALSVAAVEYYSNFEERVGRPLDFRRHGYLFLVNDERQFEQFKINAEMQRANGVQVELLTPKDVVSLVPGVDADDLVGATFTPGDGSASPADVVQAFAGEARSRGVRIQQNTPVIGIDLDSDSRVAGVRTPAGSVPAELVIIAAGPWSEGLGEAVGVDLPVEPHSRQAFGIDAVPDMPAGMPMTIDLATGAYVHPESSGAIIGGNDHDTPRSTEPKVDWGLAEQLVTTLVRRMPWMAKARIASGWAGLREMTPDHHAIVGPVLSVPGLWVSAGFSGHGFMHAPAVGDELARTLLGLPHAIDLEPLRPARFSENALISENALF